MKAIPWAMFLLLFVVACATTENNRPVLFDAYSEYSDSVSKQNIDTMAPRYFTKSLLGDDYIGNADAADQLLFKNYMATIESHFEKLESNTGCMTINGYDEKNEPMTFHLDYVEQNGIWLINEIHVAFVESEKDFGKAARCPKELGH